MPLPPVPWTPRGPQRSEVSAPGSYFSRGGADLLRWAQGLGDATPRFGLEGTGSYGAGLARHLQSAGCTVIVVNRPNRQTRQARGKSDPVPELDRLT
jgi:transposase